METKTIGVLFDSLLNAYEAQIWQDIVKISREKDINLLCFAVRKLQPHTSEQINPLFGMINPANLDGVIAFSTTISRYLEPEALVRFYQSLAPLPVISIGIPMEACPSVVVDNLSGMRSIVCHLIEKHGFNNLAFLKGPKENLESEIRFNVYKEVLAEHNLPLRKELVVPGNFLRESGTEAVSILLDKRNVQFDALICCNDYMALNAMRELRRRGLKIPEDVAVTGFDDIVESRCGIQPLTTVRQPVYELARSSIELLLSILNEKDAPFEIVLPTVFTVRRSCGCYMHTTTGDKLNRPAAPALQAKKETDTREVIELAARQMDTFFKSAPAGNDTYSWAEMLTTSLSHTLADLKNGKSFFLVLENIILSSLENGIDTLQWYPVISAVFEEFKKRSYDNIHTPELARLWRQSLALIGNIADYRYIYTNIDYREMNLKLHTISEALKNIYDNKKLTEIMQAQLGELGLQRFFLAKYIAKDNKPLESKILIAFDEKGKVPNIQQPYPAGAILPERFRYKYEKTAFVIFPLQLHDIHFGFVMYNIGDLEGSIFESITLHLNNSLHGASFFTQAKQQTLELETKATLQSYLLESTNQKLQNEIAERERTLKLLQQKDEEIMELHRQLELRSKLDRLTNLYNREALFELLKKEINRTKRNLWRIDKEFQAANSRYHTPSGDLKNHFGYFSIILMDLDNFKAFNDKYGPKRGDKVLVAISEILQKTDILRQEDISGRFSAKEFITILPNTNAKNAMPVAIRLDRAIRNIKLEENAKLTVSMGIAEYNPRADKDFSILHKAEEALYYAKNHGKNQIILYNSLKE